MKWNEWAGLNHGDKIQHKNGDVETIYEFDGDKYIEGEKSLFPLSEFDPEDWEIVKEN